MATNDSRLHSGAGAKRLTNARPLGELIARPIAAAVKKRGFATADLLSDWPDIVGERYATRVQPARLHWPRSADGSGDHAPDPATLTVHTDGATALFLTHELPTLIDRINDYFGWAAVGRIKIVQRPVVARKKAEPVPLRELTRDEECELSKKVSEVTAPHLRRALERLGRAVIAKNR
ncbi:DUF721 domain-containing protein [Stappia sp. GBMRC 2046]|uniref:DUF721 domain-containing protein n=1 Tax=Stappia sediminis TaxID=2692190 RepID=A0A7X3LVV3_9HYPH|nr:DciA family protein [Stappia sediminis]MXN66086.1 DUF721 domain-containing protein [Stappia sediminis]